MSTPSKKNDILNKTLSAVSPDEMAAARKNIVEEQAKFAQSLPPPAIPSAPPVSEGKDLRKAGEIASTFMEGMDQISNVLMILVLKFGRASTVAVAVMIGSVIGIISLWISIFMMGSILSALKSVQVEQETIRAKQELVLDEMLQTKKSLAEAEKKAAEAKEAAPKVVVDEESGKAKLVVPNVENAKPPSKSSPKKPDAAGKSVEIQLDL